MNQHIFVKECLAYYREHGITPEPGWQKAHYPVPKCLGGTETLWLRFEEHQVQGLLQSEEYGLPCFFNGDVKRMLENTPFRGYWFELWDLYEKWSGVLSRENIKKCNNHPNTKMSQSRNGTLYGSKNVALAHLARSKRISVTNIDTGITQVFESASEASRVLQLDRSKICEVARGKSRQHKRHTACYL